VQELAHELGDLVDMGFEQEVAAVEQLDLCIRDVVAEGFGAGGREDLVVSAPGGEHRDTRSAQPFVRGGVEVDVGAVAAQQGQLRVQVARSLQYGVVVVPGVGADQRRVGFAVGVLSADAVQGEAVADWLLGLWVRVGTVGPQWLPG
jgi:hypothetical protein